MIDSGRGLVETRLVENLEREHKRHARPFALQVTVLPIAGRKLRQLEADNVMISDELLRDVDEYRERITLVIEALL